VRQHLYFLDPNRKEEIIRTRALHALVKYAGEGTVQVHKPAELLLMDRSVLGTLDITINVSLFEVLVDVE
jgi:hypothetical protein